MRQYMAFDFGASGGRAMLGRFDGAKLTLDQIHRFPNDPVWLKDTLYWDFPRLVHEMKQGLWKAAQAGYALDSMGVDTWGVDFGLLDKRGELMQNPVHYRDARTDGMYEEAFSRMPRREIYARTGIAFQKFNTLYQLLALRMRRPETLDRAHMLLFMPDLFAYYLCGEAAAEYTIASTGQLLGAKTRELDAGLLAAMGIPKNIFTRIEQPGAVRGTLLGSVSEATGIRRVPVVSAPGHDTASAVLAVPAHGRRHAYISSGTWSLMGVEAEEPVLSDAAYAANYTNEGGVAGTIRLLRNIMGLWIIQQLREQWQREGTPLSFPDMVALAEKAEPFKSFIDPDDDLFYAPGDMPKKVADFCRAHGQPVPEGKGEIIRTVYESLAMKYRWSLERLEEILSDKIEEMHIVGGGSQNRLLNQFTANAIGRIVYAGPSEATAAGNVLMQAIALKDIKDVAQARQVVRDSFEVEPYEPQNAAAWDDAYAKYLRVQP